MCIHISVYINIAWWATCADHYAVIVSLSLILYPFGGGQKAFELSALAYLTMKQNERKIALPVLASSSIMYRKYGPCHLRASSSSSDVIVYKHIYSMRDMDAATDMPQESFVFFSSFNFLYYYYYHFYPVCQILPFVLLYLWTFFYLRIRQCFNIKTWLFAYRHITMLRAS